MDRNHLLETLRYEENRRWAEFAFFVQGDVLGNTELLTRSATAFMIESPAEDDLTRCVARRTEEITGTTP